MPGIKAIYTAAVKSLALQARTQVSVGPSGIVEDRRFHLISGNGGLVTQRQRPELALVSASYDVETDTLSMVFPGGQEFSVPPELGEPVRTLIWGRLVPGNVIPGDWNAALSELCRGPVRLVRTGDSGLSFDEFPVSLLSQASLDFLEQRAGGEMPFDARRFRPSFLLDGCAVHEEDSWLGSVVAVGPELRIRVVAPDPRCAITTVNPETGKRDFDTPRLLLTYRPATRAPYFGVYAVVETPGVVSVGDEVGPVEQ